MHSRIRLLVLAPALLSAGVLFAQRPSSSLPEMQGSAPVAPTTGDAAAGETLFFGRAACASCHEVNGRGGVVGPDLSNAGRLTASVLRQKIAEPDGGASVLGRGGPAAASTVVVTTREGREIRGVRRNEDTFSLQMVDASGQLHLLDKLKLASISVENKSLHPSDDGTRLAARDIADLVAYLRAQQGRDAS